MNSKNGAVVSCDEIKPFSCESCGRQFATSAYLAQHRRIHSGIKPYACRFCDRKFTQLSHVQQHERIHTGEKPYSCYTCLKTFTQMSNLHSHQRQHMKNKPCKCSHCFMAFDSQLEFDNHMESKHSAVKYNKVLVCPLCSKLYNSETYLKKHVKRHEESGKTIDSSPKNGTTCDSVIEYGLPTKLVSPNSLTAPLDTNNSNNKSKIDVMKTNRQIVCPTALTRKDSHFIENGSTMEHDISKSIVTAASGLSLNVILENLASSNCPSPLVSAAASMWGHPLLPLDSNRVLQQNNSNLTTNYPCFHLSSNAADNHTGKHSKTTKQELIDHINRSTSEYNSFRMLTSHSHISALVSTCTNASKSTNISSPHINIPLPAFSLQ